MHHLKYKPSLLILLSNLVSMIGIDVLNENNIRSHIEWESHETH